MNVPLPFSYKTKPNQIIIKNWSAAGGAKSGDITTLRW
jgi:hypothetical protein